MAKAGLEGDCDACDDAREGTAKLPEEQREALPLPGEVDFICGEASASCLGVCGGVSGLRWGKRWGGMRVGPAARGAVGGELLLPGTT